MKTLTSFKKTFVVGPVVTMARKSSDKPQSGLDYLQAEVQRLKRELRVAELNLVQYKDPFAKLSESQNMKRKRKGSLIPWRPWKSFP